MPPTFVTFVVPQAAPATFSIEDARADESRTSIVRQGEDAIYVRYGDEIISPAPAEIMRGYLQALVGQQIAGKKVVLTQFLIEVTTNEVTYSSGSKPILFISNPRAPRAANAVAAAIVSAFSESRGKGNFFGSGQMVVVAHVIGTVDESEFTGDSYVKAAHGDLTEDDFRVAIARAMKECAWRIDGSKRDSPLR